MIDRHLLQRLQAGSRSVLLLGPRQVGKSTLTCALNPTMTVNLADESLFLQYSKDAARLKREVNALNTGGLVLIDEVQRAPSLLNSVQAVLDERKDIRFILTGSSARKLKRGGANLLPGRIVLEYLDPLSYWEMGPLFDLEKVLRIGSLPGIYLDADKDPSALDVLSTYATVYLREEIQAEAMSKNIGAYARFLDLAARESGNWINYSKMASDAEIPKETLRRFYSILEETLLVFRIPPFKPKKAKRRVSQRDRFVFFDTGVRNALLGIHKGNISPLEKGMLFEQWIILQCIAHTHVRHKEWTFSSYRTDGGAEVDFVIDAGDKLVAVECKYGANAAESQMTGLRSFEEVAHKPVEKYVVYQGDTKQIFSKGEMAVPYRIFLSEIVPSF